MHVLIDYDNIHISYRQRGLAYVIQQIADAIGPTLFAGTSRVTFRLYGGWLTETGISRAAQRLAPDLGSFPQAIVVSAGPHSARLIAAVEFAYSLICEPAVHLPYTYRERTATNLGCKPAPFHACANATGCPLSHLAGFINAGACPSHACAVQRDDVLFRPEQKLVDTLLVSDLLYLANSGSNDLLVVVSTDDDMWPGIRLALLGGRRVLQVHPVRGRSLHSRYIVRMPTGYLQSTLT
jgi:hypothetical protein